MKTHCVYYEVGTEFLYITDIKRKTCDIRTWKKQHWFLEMSSTNIDTLRNYWVFGLCPSSGNEKLENSVSETGSVSVLRWGGRPSLGSVRRANHSTVVQWLRSALSDRPKRIAVSPPHLRAEIDPLSETSCTFEYRTIDKVHKSTNCEYVREFNCVTGMSHVWQHKLLGFET
jgi:hypothetical protein